MSQYVEMQFDTKLMLTILRNALILADQGSGKVFNAGMVSYVIDSIDIYPTTTLHHTTPDTFRYFYDDGFGYGLESDAIPSRKVEIIQHMQVNLMSRRATPKGPVLAPAGSVTGDLVIQMDAYVGGGMDAFISLQVRDFVLDPIDDADLAAALPKVVKGAYALLNSTSQIPPPAKDKKSAGLLGGIKFINAGITVGGQGAFVAVRMQVGLARVQGIFLSWQQFLSGNTPGHLAVPNNPLHFAVLLSGQFVENMVRNQLGQQLAATAAKFRLISGVGVHWAPKNGQPHLDADWYGDAVAACLPFGWDISYNVTAAVDLSLPQPDQIQSTAQADWSADFWDLFGCEMAMGLLGFAIEVGGQLFAAPFALPTLTGMGFITGFFGTMIAASVYTPTLVESPSSPPGPCDPVCTQNGKSITCTQPICPDDRTIPFGGGKMVLTITALNGAPDGLVMGGTVPGMINLTPTVLEIKTQPFAWSQPLITCGGLTSESAKNLLNNLANNTQPVAQATLTAVGQRPLLLNSAQVVSPDPLGVFPPQNIQVLGYNNSYVVSIKAQPTPAYFQNPYSCVVEFNTNLGKPRQVELGPVPELTSAVLDGLRKGVQQMISDCNVAVDSFWGATQRFNPKWRIDPNPGDKGVRRLWQIRVTGLQPGERLQGLDAGGKVLTSVTANRQGVAGLRLLASLDEIEVQRSMGGPGMPGISTMPGGVPTAAGSFGTTSAGAEKTFRVRQIELAFQAKLDLDAAPGSYDLDHARLAAVSGSGLFVFDLSYRNAPRLLFQRRLEGAQGALLDPAGVLIWGPGGLQRLDSETVRPVRLLDQPVAAALRLGERLLLALPDQLAWFDIASGGLAPLANLPGAFSLGLGQGRLAAAARGGLFTLDLASADSRDPAGRPVLSPQAVELAMPVARVEAPALRSQPQEFLVSFAGDGSAVYDLAEPAVPVELERFDAPAWFAGARRSGALLALPEEGGLGLYAAGQVVDS